MIHVLYVDNCSPKVVTFKNQEDATGFIDLFMTDNDDPMGTWIEMIVEGKILFSERENGKNTSCSLYFGTN